MLTCALVVTLLAGCSSDDKGSDGSGKDGPDAPAAATVAKADLVACLTGAGLEAKDSDVVYPEELIERDRIVETVDITGIGELTGLGSATWFEDEGAAVAGDEAAGLVRTDEVRRGVAGPVAWDWVGEDAAADVIEECLSAVP